MPPQLVAVAAAVACRKGSEGGLGGGTSLFGFLNSSANVPLLTYLISFANVPLISSTQLPDFSFSQLPDFMAYNFSLAQLPVFMA